MVTGRAARAALRVVPQEVPQEVSEVSESAGVAVVSEVSEASEVTGVTGVGVTVGAHVPALQPLEEAALRGAGCAQLFVSSPRQWAPPRRRADAEQLAASGLPLFVHAPYLVNLASPDPTVRDRSVVLLQQTLDAAGHIGARGVVVHAGQAGAASRFDDGLDRWLAAAAALSGEVPLLVENVAGGSAPMGRTLAELSELVSAARAALDVPVGVCLDTCHSWAAGEIVYSGAGEDGAALVTAATVYAAELVSATGPVDLVHVNGSRDPAGSGRDRHDNLDAGCLPLAVTAALVAAVRTRFALVETPGGAHRQGADIGLLVDALS
jgi:deoxyribonuclease-4